jgi:hypothetical protein
MHQSEPPGGSKIVSPDWSFFSENSVNRDQKNQEMKREFTIDDGLRFPRQQG